MGPAALLLSCSGPRHLHCRPELSLLLAEWWKPTQAMLSQSCYSQWVSWSSGGCHLFSHSATNSLQCLQKHKLDPQEVSASDWGQILSCSHNPMGYRRVGDGDGGMDGGLEKVPHSEF